MSNYDPNNLYVTVLLGVASGILFLIFAVYPLVLALLLRQNPCRILGAAKEAMVLAFVTRSSAATLPVSIRVSEEHLGVNRELASFALPLGATVNMDGVCVHLPMFTILAANMFETMGNVTGDILCTYAVASHEGLTVGVTSPT